MLRLYTFAISHFSEKARWALDFEGIPYEEKVLVPGPHQFVTRWRARASHVPVLDHDGRVVQGSSAILDYIGSHLHGSKLVPRGGAWRELELELDEAFGLGVQRVLYSAALEDRATVTRLWSARGPFWARGFYAVAYPGVAAVVKRMYRTNDPEAVEASKRLFFGTFDRLDGILERQAYLGGEAPDRNDLTVAALLAPLCRPPEHLLDWPQVPDSLSDFEAGLRDRPTWNHALRMYREHRAAS